MNYEGLKVVTQADHVWTWRGHEEVVNKSGAPVRVEVWSRLCRACGKEFCIRQKMPTKVAKRYQRAVEREGRPVSVIVFLPRRYGSLELVNCPAHRWWGPAEALV